MSTEGLGKFVRAAFVSGLLGEAGLVVVEPQASEHVVPDSLIEKLAQPNGVMRHIIGGVGYFDQADGTQ